MAIINRVSRLFTADIHAVLDRMEEPVVLLRHCIREMEEELADSERRVKALACEREQIASKSPIDISSSTGLSRRSSLSSISVSSPARKTWRVV